MLQQFEFRLYVGWDEEKHEFYLWSDIFRRGKLVAGKEWAGPFLLTLFTSAVTWYVSVVARETKGQAVFPVSEDDTKQLPFPW